jgi:O-antigen/teichoic acid export membrane protein
MVDSNDSELNKSLNLLAKTSVVVFIGVILSKLFTYIYKIIIARYFDPEVYGLFNLAIMIIGILAALATLGLPDGLIRFISYDRKNRYLSKSKYLFNLSSKIIFTISIVLTIIFYLLAEFISVSVFKKPELTIYLEIFSLSLPFLSVTSIMLSLIRAFEKIGIYSLIQNILQNLIRLIIIIILLLLGWSVGSILGSYIISVILITIISYLFSRKYILALEKNKDIKEKDKKSLRKDFFDYSWPIVFLGIIGSLLYWTDSFVIGYFMKASDVGFYNVAFTLIGLLGIAPELFMQLFLPLVVKEYSKNRLELIQEISKQIAKWILIINVPIFVIMIIYPGVIINVLFGADYLSAETPLRILAIGGFFVAIFMSLSSNLLSMKGKSKLLLINTLFIAFFNFILNVLLVPKYGLNGAAFATMVSWFLFGSILLFQVKHYLNIVPIRRKMISIVLMGFFASGVLLLIKNMIPSNLFGLALAGIIFVLIYVFFIVKLGGLDRNDKRVFDSIKNKINLK